MIFCKITTIEDRREIFLMLYSDAVAQLYTLGYELHGVPGHKFEIAQMRTLNEALGNPQQRFQSILVAGTNGKGSTASTLASILRSAGYRTGLFTSPHLLCINERIRINGVPIGDEDFAAAFTRVDEIGQQLLADGAIPNLPSFFETVTAMAFCFFAAQSVPIVVMEVGLGGRLDATNTVEPILSVITDIGLDHQDYLGDTLGEIAAEKAGILRAGISAITLPQNPEVDRVLNGEIARVGARPVNAARNLAPGEPALGSRTRFRLRREGKELEVDSPLVGRHQHRNLALAITAAEELNNAGFPISAEALERGVRETYWPGRFQVLPAKDGVPTIVVDVAHNPDGASALRAALAERFPGRPRLMLFGAMRDKAIREMAEILFPTAERVIVTTTAMNPRAATTADLLKISAGLCAQIEAVETVPGAIDRLKECARQYQDPILVLTGSIYIIGEVMSSLGIEA
jgi:dihydrofolate synthase/folylpolyglutamate synthase